MIIHFAQKIIALFVCSTLCMFNDFIKILGGS